MKTIPASGVSLGAGKARGRLAFERTAANSEGLGFSFSISAICFSSSSISGSAGLKKSFPI